MEKGQADTLFDMHMSGDWDKTVTPQTLTSIATASVASCVSAAASSLASLVDKDEDPLSGIYSKCGWG